VFEIGPQSTALNQDLARPATTAGPSVAPGCPLPGKRAPNGDAWGAQRPPMERVPSGHPIKRLKYPGFKDCDTKAEHKILLADLCQ
jgi:hypothetical protein